MHIATQTPSQNDRGRFPPQDRRFVRNELPSIQKGRSKPGKMPKSGVSVCPIGELREQIAVIRFSIHTWIDEENGGSEASFEQSRSYLDQAESIVDSYAMEAVAVA